MSQSQHRIQGSWIVCLQYGKIPAHDCSSKPYCLYFRWDNLSVNQIRYVFPFLFCQLILLFLTTHKCELLLKFLSSYLPFCCFCVFFIGKAIISIMMSLKSSMLVLTFILSFSFTCLLICRHLNLDIVFLPNTQQDLKLNS